MSTVRELIRWNKLSWAYTNNWQSGFQKVYLGTHLDLMHPAKGCSYVTMQSFWRLGIPVRVRRNTPHLLSDESVIFFFFKWTLNDSGQSWTVLLWRDMLIRCFKSLNGLHDQTCRALHLSQSWQVMRAAAYQIWSSLKLTLLSQIVPQQARNKWAGGSTSFNIFQHLSTPFNIFQHRSPSFNIFQHLSTPFNIFQHLSTSFNISQHLSTSFNIFQHRSTSFNIVQHRSTLFNIFQHLSTSFNIFQHLSTSFNTVQHLSTSFNIFQPKWSIS